MEEEEDKEEDKEEKRPLRTKDDALNPENVKAEKLRSKDVLDDVLNAVRVCVMRFLNKRCLLGGKTNGAPFLDANLNFSFRFWSRV